jgi:hypothetical protein
MEVGEKEKIMFTKWWGKMMVNHFKGKGDEE